MGVLHSLISSSLPLVPKPIVQRVASRYVAGEGLDEAIGTIRALEGQGLEVTLALLGEEVTERSKASMATDEYVAILDRLSSEEVSATISAKLTLLGLKVDEGFCSENLDRLVSRAKECGNFVRIDMEDHTCTDATLRLYRQALEKHGNVGTVLQSYLKRTLDDIRGLGSDADIRLCKGIYIEPESVAYKDYQKIRDNFLECLGALFDMGARVAVASHDEWLVDGAEKMVEERSLGPERYEFQTLLGVAERLRDRLHASGHTVRVYVPFGADWYEYSIRRLRENPQIAVNVMRAMVGV